MKADLFCQDCNTPIIRQPGKPGRPPSRCPDCRDKLTAAKVLVARRKKIDPKERVDRLEMMLKANGTHPSQYRKD